MLTIADVWSLPTEWIQMSLEGMTSLWGIGFALILTSFVLEDVAIAAAAGLASHGQLTWLWAFAWVFTGIALGDLGLYAMGLGARRIAWLRIRFIEKPQKKSIRSPFNLPLSTSILISRVVPGLRLVTYTLCGFYKVSLTAFIRWVALAVSLWVAALFGLGAVIGEVLSTTLHIPHSIAVALPILLVGLSTVLFKHWPGRKIS